MTRAYQVATGHNIGWDYSNPPDLLSLAGPQFMRMGGGVVGDSLIQGAGNTLVWATAPPAVARTVIGSTPPASPANGQLWFDDVGSQLYVSYDDGNSQQWVAATNISGVVAGAAGATVGIAPPATPVNGQLWFDDAGAQLYMFYDDGTSKQWVATSNISGITGNAAVGTAPPATPTNGQMWFDDVGGNLYVNYDDGTSKQWVAATNISGALVGNYLPLTGGVVTGTVTAATLQTGTTAGPTWTTGAAAPAATAPVGSLYSRTGGAVGATLYVSRGGGSWSPVAGV